MKSWIRNLSGFFYNIIKRVALGSFKAKEEKRIYNYHKVPNLFETSGQPGKQQLKLLARRGYEVSSSDTMVCRKGARRFS